MKHLFTYVILLIVAFSCTTHRKLTYFNNLNSTSDYRTAIKNDIEPTIQADDLLSITVATLNPESNILFNNGAMPTVGPSISSGGSGATSSPAANKSNEGYLVDKDGSINFPVLGKIQLAGLTKEQATEKLVGEIKKSVKNPIVNIRFLNFKITVIGEVNRPSTFTVPTEKISVLEALGLAGDMTPFGKRENVLVIREKDGVRSAIRIDFTDKNLLNSPYFYLQQNDVVYVEPVKAKALQSGTSNFYLPIISVAITLVSVLVFTLVKR